ncbi:hypothetical protein H0O02_01840 [Candidatus Micrarchaeota archaeon]|nr:hypothetical protein [Candidatus Micrarchaeota archaeon]
MTVIRRREFLKDLVIVGASGGADLLASRERILQVFKPLLEDVSAERTFGEIALRIEHKYLAGTKSAFDLGAMLDFTSAFREAFGKRYEPEKGSQNLKTASKMYGEEPFRFTILQTVEEDVLFFSEAIGKRKLGCKTSCYPFLDIRDAFHLPFSMVRARSRVKNLYHSFLRWHNDDGTYVNFHPNWGADGRFTEDDIFDGHHTKGEISNGLYMKDLERNEELSDIFCNLGYYFHCFEKRPELAEKSYRKALLLDKSNVLALHNLSLVLFDAGRREEAMNYASLATVGETEKAIENYNAMRRLVYGN